MEMLAVLTMEGERVAVDWIWASWFWVWMGSVWVVYGEPRKLS